MKLTKEQLEQFDEEGYLFFPNYFSPEETAILKSEVPGVFQQRREENVREKTGDVVRTAFAVHTYHPVFEALVHHPRFVEPAEQLLRDRTYIHQFKINGKAAFDGDVWQWHQDYGTWKADDDMPEARAMNLAVFVDEVNEFNGPLWFIPRSHRKGAIEAKHDLTTTSYPLWVIDNDTIAKLVAQGGIVSPKGGPGSAIFFHGTLVHGSPPNMSPWDRQIIYVTYNAVSNAIRRFKRPAHIAHRDFTPIDAWEDDAVLRAARRKAAAE
jgi:ectoine hydroxylase